MLSPTERFSSRVAEYVRYRPSYPPEIVALLMEKGALAASSDVADVGSGTGNLARLFLEKGAAVYGVEPNQAMREAGEKQLASYSRFRSVDGTAEATGLEDSSIDLAVAGQSFHWFRQSEAKREFLRVLRPGGWCALIWNERLEDASRFLREYERLSRQLEGVHKTVNHKDISSEALRSFFGGQMEEAEFPNSQTFDLEGLIGRSVSSSYVPQKGQPGHEEFVEALSRLFESENQAGKVDFLYRAVVYYGQIQP